MAEAVVGGRIVDDGEAQLDGVGTPVERPEVSVSGAEFVLDGQGAAVNAPAIEKLGTAGIPVGDSNSAAFPVLGFDNKGVIVEGVVPQAGPPVGNATETKLFSPPLNFNR